MKYLILALATSFSISASADCNTQVSAEEATEQLVISTDVPNHLKGATVCVKLATGKESCVPAEKFKVVPRKQQYIVTKTKQSSQTTCSAEQRRNRVSLVAGQGPTGNLDRGGNSTHATVESDHGAMAGVMYQRLLPVFNDRLSVGGQAVGNDFSRDNKTFLGTIGIEF